MERMERIYIVKEYGGEWEDRWERNVCAFEDKADAQKLADEITEEHKRKEKQKERCRNCMFVNGIDCEKPDCFTPFTDDPYDCELYSEMMFDDWDCVEVRELQFIPKKG